MSKMIKGAFHTWVFLNLFERRKNSSFNHKQLHSDKNKWTDISDMTRLKRKKKRQEE